MSDLLNYIKLQKNKGLDQYTVLKSARRFSQRRNANDSKFSQGMRGGAPYTLTDTEKAEVHTALKTMNPSVDGYAELVAAAQGDGTLENYDDYEMVKSKLAQMKGESGQSLIQQEEDEEAAPLTLENTELVDVDEPVITKEIRQIKGPGADKTTIQIETYATLNPGDVLFYPTQDIKHFDDAMMFVDIPKVLDQSKQRSFTMFFTPNEEYARRYSGIWSLNKRPVYVHKLAVKKGMPINRIKIVNSKKIGDSISNDELAHGMCGDSIDGFINGIKIEQTLGDKASVEEYYICNPANFFDHLETWMQFSATEWVKISKENTKTIQIPVNQIEKTEQSQSDVELSAL